VPLRSSVTKVSNSRISSVFFRIQGRERNADESWAASQRREDREVAHRILPGPLDDLPCWSSWMVCALVRSFYIFAEDD